MTRKPSVSGGTAAAAAAAASHPSSIIIIIITITNKIILIVTMTSEMIVLSRRVSAAAVGRTCLFLIFTLVIIIGNDNGGRIVWSASAFGSIAPSSSSSSALSLRSSSSSFRHRDIQALLAFRNNPIESPLLSSSLSSFSTTSSSKRIKEDFPSASSSTSSSSISSDNTPPNLQSILHSLSSLKSGSDIRGKFVNHKCTGGTIANFSHLLKQGSSGNGGDAAILTPLAAHCFGVAFARWSIEMKSRLFNLHTNDDYDNNDDGDDNILTICVGRDPRLHGERLADSFARGAESVVIMGDDGGGNEVRVKVVYTGIATTPSMYEFVRANKCDAAVMSEFV